MNDLISRQAALAEIDKNREALLSRGMTGAEHILVHYGRRVIEELPTIEPKRGKWIFENRTWFHQPLLKCSCCGRRQFVARFDYCPNCGARMERSEE